MTLSMPPSGMRAMPSAPAGLVEPSKSLSAPKLLGRLLHVEQAVIVSKNTAGAISLKPIADAEILVDPNLHTRLLFCLDASTQVTTVQQ